MLVESMATSLVVGKVRGGKIKNIEHVNIKGWQLFIVSFLIEFVSLYFGAKTGTISDFVRSNFIYIHAVSYLILTTALILNYKSKSMMIILIGTLLNFIVIMANNGQMPVSGEHLKALGLIKNYEMLEAGSVLTHTFVNGSTKLKILGDIIPIIKPYPFPKVISIGDIFLMLGIFTFLQGAMLKSRRWFS